VRLNDINPFLRNALQASNHSFVTGRYIMAYDHRLFYVANGKGTVSFSNNTHCITKGDLMLIGPAAPYFLVADAEDGLELIILNFDYTNGQSQKIRPFRPVAADVYDPGLIVERVHFDDYQFLNGPLVLHHLQHLEIDLHEIVREFMEHKILYREKASGITKKLLVDVVRAATVTNGKYSGTTETLVSAAIDYIRGHYQDDSVNNTDIGAALNYHSYYINHLMKAYTGMSMHQYLTTLRMRIALDLLTSTQNSIGSIAANVGYKTQAHFSSCFKKVIGKRPMAYRQDFLGV
jgi:AraC-like DNA-binding protein